MYSVGIPREIKTLEKRVGLTPEGVAALRTQGITVFVETKAGLNSGFSDHSYQDAGAVILETPTALYECAEIIQKVKEPQGSEFSLLRKDHILFCFLHLASPEHYALKNALIKSGCTAIGFETLEVNGKLPLLAPMSEIAGGLAASYSSFISDYLISSPHRVGYKPGLLEAFVQAAQQYPEPVKNSFDQEVIIFGAGVAGRAALKMLLTLGAHCSVIEKNEATRQALLKECVPSFSPNFIPEEILTNSSILIGCAHSIGRRACHVLSEDHLAKASQRMKKIIIDISIDQGGNFPDSHSTSYVDPCYVDQWGNIRIGIPNLPSLAGRMASEALSAAGISYTIKLATMGSHAALSDLNLRKAVNVKDGQILRDEIRITHES